MNAVKAHEPNRKITSYGLNGDFYNAQEMYSLLFLENIEIPWNPKKESYKTWIKYLEEFKLAEKDSYYPYEIVYDFEARMNKLEYKDDKQLKIKRNISPSVCLSIQIFQDMTQPILYVMRNSKY
jgi:hypothetical protein